MRAWLLLSLASLASGAQFSTTLHGAPTELIEPGTPGATTLQLQPWLTNYDPNAVCNDGTPAGYYWKAGTDPTLWLLYLEGGYWCWDGPSCTERYQTLKFDMSSADWQSLFAQDGLFGTDPTENPFAAANMIFIKYCSSDSWFGDAGNSSATFGFSFRGSRIVSAAVTALVSAHGMGSSGGPERLLFAGCSAGGRGVLTNLDAVAAAVPTNVQVQGMLDAAAWVDVQPIIPGMLTLQEMTQDLYTFTSPPVPADCAAKYSGSDAWMCVWPSYRLPFVVTDYFMTAAQFDAFQIMYDTNNLDDTYCCTTPAEQQYVEQFQTATLQLFTQLPSTAVIFSSACLVHCLSSNDDFFQFTVNNISLQTAVANWFFAGAPANVIESCTGWDCTLQCSGGPWEPTNTPCASTTNVCANTYMYTTPPAPDSAGATPALPAPAALAGPLPQSSGAVAAPSASPVAATPAFATPASSPPAAVSSTDQDEHAEKSLTALGPAAAPGGGVRLAGRSYEWSHVIVLGLLVIFSVFCGAFCQHYCRRARRRMRRAHEEATETTQLL